MQKRVAITGFVLFAFSLLNGQSLADGVWYRMGIQETGIYKLDRAFFQGANVANFSAINAIRIFGSDGKALNENPSGPHPAGLLEIPRHVVDRNGNGVFDADDFVLFYGRSTRWWNYDAATKSFSHYLNYYTETNVYYFSFSAGGTPKVMDTLLSVQSNNPYLAPDVHGKVMVEEELFKLGTHSGREWVGRFLNRSSNSTSFATLLNGLDPSKTILYRYVVLTRSSTIDTFRVEENGQPLGNPTLMDRVDVTSIETNFAYRSPVVTATRSGNLPDGRSVLRFVFGTRNDAAEAWIDWFEIHYRQKLEAVNDLLVFHSVDTTATVEYALSKFSSGEKFAFDATDHSNVKRITGVMTNPADTLRLPQTAGGVREIVVVGPNGYKTPTNVVRLPNSNVRGIVEGAEFVIISPEEFLAEANRLKDHRQQINPLSTTVVNVTSIFNEYSSGIADPTGLRNFLIDARTRWTRKPKYVLLFGDGHYDYKNIRSTVRNWIPPYETVNTIQQIQTYTTDDYFVLLDPANQRVSLRLGRLPVRSVAEARVAVDKIIRYETSAPFDPWRNRVTFVADDGLTSTRDDGNIHTYQADLLATSFTPASIDRRKIYIVEYPTVNSALGRRKPEANKAIIDAINRGTLIINYTGHGNTKVWAHEWVFTKDESIPRLRNSNRLPLLVAATCDFARFDNPDEHSGGEEMVTMEGGGAIAVITAVRAVYSFENSQFNNTLFSYLFQRDSLGNPVRLGDAMFSTKQILNSTNDLKYHLFGDPTLTIAMPRAVASVDSVNGNPSTSPVQVPSLGVVSITGQLKRSDGTMWSTFSGRGLVEVFDSKRRVVVPEFFSYEVNGSLLHRGEISIAGGSFRALFPIPKDVSYDNNRARIAVYAWSDSTDAIGYTENITIAGTDSGVVVDTVGPVISIFLEDYNFRPGDVVKPDALLMVDVRDQSGINTSTAGIGHRLEARLSTSGGVIDLSDFYRSNLDTYQSGQVRYSLSDLPEGRHTLSVKAWDIHNNSSVAETFFEVRAGEILSIYNAVNLPNPFSRNTVFTFQRNSTLPIHVDLKIYTVSGKLIQRLEHPITERFVQIPWDGRDRDGHEVANGIYFYKISVRSPFLEGSSEVIGKCAVLR